MRATEALVRAKHDPTPPRERPSSPARPAKSASALDLEERLTRALGAPVTLDEDGGSAKSGTITLRYLDLDHLDRLLDKLLVE